MDKIIKIGFDEKTKTFYGVVKSKNGMWGEKRYLVDTNSLIEANKKYSAFGK